ncbi:MAG: hypothetical protein GTO18_18015 [Anaerolineales bacterium]|nr:hypothetical protein [Anaerolineales bacterium]
MKHTRLLLGLAIINASIILSGFGAIKTMWGAQPVLAASIETDEESTIDTGNDQQESAVEAPKELKGASGAWEYSSKKRSAAQRASSSSHDESRSMKQLLPEKDMSEDAAEGSSRISDIGNLPEDFQIRLPMEEQYHSQLTETDQPNTCGPTSLYMILDYYDLEDSLAAVIEKHKIPTARGGYDPNCVANPVCTSPGALAKVAQEEYGLSVEAREGWTFEEIHGSLASGRPIIADIVWRLKDEGPGHFVVIFGIDTEQRTIQYHDPYDGADKTASWDDFATAWDGPVDLGDPLQPEGHRFWGMAVGFE